MNYVLHSGGAFGADSFFDEIAALFNVQRIHYFHGKKTPLGNKLITDAELNEGWQEILKVNLILKRQGIEQYKSLLGRNWFQVKYSEAIYAVGSLSNKGIDGGTAWAVGMAALNNKPVYFFDQNSNKWFNVSKHPTKNSFLIAKSDITKLTKQFGGIGSRNLNASGKEAIHNLFKLTFKSDDLKETIPT